MGSPGSILFWIPSRPAINMAANAKYPLHAGSGGRNSTRLALGFCEYIGMRQQAERLRCEYTRLIGASKPGTSRREELTVGAAKPSSAGACLSSPPI